MRGREGLDTRPRSRVWSGGSRKRNGRSSRSAPRCRGAPRPSPPGAEALGGERRVHVPGVGRGAAVAQERQAVGVAGHHPEAPGAPVDRGLPPELLVEGPGIAGHPGTAGS